MERWHAQLGGSPNGGYRPPMRAPIFFLETDDLRIGGGYRQQREQAGVVRQREPLGGGRGARGRIPRNCGLHGPEDRGRGLVGGACGAVARAYAPDLGEVACELRAVDGGCALEREARPAG